MSRWFLCSPSFFYPRLNHTYLCLIPKVSHQESVHQYRPISLSNTVYKLVAKILVTRIRPFLRNLINPFQSSFVPGRRGTDNVILLQETIHSFNLKSGGRGYMIIKLDLEKAYDRLDVRLSSNLSPRLFLSIP